MGAEIHILLKSDVNDEKELAPFLGRDFHSEVTRGRVWDGKEPFLTEAEIELLEAPYYEDIEDERVKPIDPKDLINVLGKVKKYLKDKKDELPFEIEVDIDKMEKENLSSDLIVNGSKCWMKGDSLYYHVFDKVQIVTYPLEPNEVDKWISFSDTIYLEGKKYYLKKTTRIEKFEDTINEVIEFCRIAESEKDEIYWLYSH